MTGSVAVDVLIVVALGVWLAGVVGLAVTVPGVLRQSERFTSRPAVACLVAAVMIVGWPAVVLARGVTRLGGGGRR